MKKTIAARETADAMHAAEDALGVALRDAKTALTRMKAAKVELGMTGTVGDAAIARWSESVQLLDVAWTTMTESHQDAYRALQAVNIRGVAYLPTQWIENGSDVEAA